MKERTTALTAFLPNEALKQMKLVKYMTTLYKKKTIDGL